MLLWALIFFVFSIIAAVFGFSGLATASASVAQILFYSFLILSALMIIYHLVKNNKTNQYQ